MSFAADSGVINWIDMPITSASSAGVYNSYSANLNGSPMLTVGGNTDGSGNIVNSGVGIGTTTPYGTLAISPLSNSYPAFNIATTTGSNIGTYFIVDGTGKVGIGTSSPYRALSVYGSSDLGNNALAGSFTATSTATSTFTGGIQTNLLNVTSATASSSFANGINLTAGCYAMGNSCLGLSNLAGLLNLSNQVTGTLAVTNGGTGQTSFSQGWLGINDSGAFVSSTSPTVNYITATSTTATSTFAGGLTAGTNAAFAVNAAAAANSLYINPSGSVGIGTSLLAGVKFKVSLSSGSVSDGYDDSSKIASNSNIAVSGSQIALNQAVCGSYSVTGQDGLPYGTVVGEDGNCWLDRNLGAKQVATANNNGTGYGDFYQWGRAYDGHQATTSSVVGEITLAAGNYWTPAGTPKTGVASPYTTYFATSSSDWLPAKNDNLWQGVNGTNNPCPTGFRLPTQTEWAMESSHFSPYTSVGAFASALKLPLAGYRGYSSAGLNSQGSIGYYWSSSPNGTNAFYLYFDSGGVTPSNTNSRADGFSVRCLKN